MGLLSWLEKKVEQALDFIGDVVDSVAGLFRKTKTDTQTEYGAEEKFNPGSTKNVTDYGRIAAEHVEKMSPIADMLEQKCITTFLGFFQPFISTISEAGHSDLALRIQSRGQEHEAAIKGTMKKYISSCLSSDNKRFRTIIEMPAGQEKESAMGEYQDTMIQAAIGNLCISLQQMAESLNTLIRDGINNRMEGINNIYTATLNDYGTILSELQSNNNQRKRKEILKSAALLDQSGYVLARLVP